ncbi:MAG: cytochrome c [Oceanospirillales bacterium]|nr:cytochrome c [Oceanospirillales bacterium]
MNHFRLLALSLTMLLMSGCESKPDANAVDGETLFNYYCAGCHKESGKGSFLEGIPANRATTMSESEVTRLIMHGKANMQNMPSFSHLSEQQARNIAQHLLRRLAKQQ